MSSFRVLRGAVLTALFAFAFSSAAYAEMWAAYKNGSNGTTIGQFDPATGASLASVDPDIGQPISFTSFGGFSYDPAGNLWVAYRGGGNDTFVGRFDPITGDQMGGAYLDINQPVAFDTFGGLSFDPNGNLWAAYRGGGNDTFIGLFDPLTGDQMGGAYLDIGQPVAFTSFGGFSFDPDGNLWAAYSAGGNHTFIGQFDPHTGDFLGGAYPNIGQNISFPSFGGLAFRPNSGTGAPAVPEPATWLMMIVGFGLIGAFMRSGRAPSRFAALAA